MNVSSIPTFGSAAIASPPTNDTAPVKRDEKPPEIPQVEAAKPPGTGQLVDIKV